MAKWQKMVENRSQVKIDDICQKWQEMDFRVFHVIPLLLPIIVLIIVGSEMTWRK